MSREWQPGDVVVLEVDGMTLRGIVDVDGRFYTTDERGKGIPANTGEMRPLVVIDPEDEDAVDRLRREVMGALSTASPLGTWQAALRSLIAPPKPDEPKGLGAVVEDADGERWIRAARIKHGWHRPMGTWAAYEEITAVRVLSEGVL